FVVFWAGRISQWCYVVEHCASRYLDLFGALPPETAAAAGSLVAYADSRCRLISDVLEMLRPALDRAEGDLTAAAQAAGVSTLSLELVMSGAPGTGVWGVTVGFESDAPCFSERHLACFNIVRDGQPRAYQVDLPLTLGGTLHLQ